MTHQVVATNVTKLAREVRLLRLVWWWAARVILIGVTALELLFRLH
jgi:hypothetical protein